MLNCEALTPEAYGTDVPGWGHIMANNLGAGASSPSNEITNINEAECTLNNNYFDLDVTVTPEDFIAYDIELLKAPRNVDGSLPDTDFLKLASGSDLIEAGYDVGFSYSGSAPDLGYSEFSTLSTKKNDFYNTISSFPNPFSNQTNVVFNLKRNTDIEVSIYNLMGVRVLQIPTKTYYSGENRLKIERNELASGNYLLILKGSNNQKLIKIITAK